VVESDVRAAALGEAVFGAGKQSHLFVYVSAGTGISYCLVQDGHPFTGANGNAITLASSPLSTVCTHCGVQLHPVLEEFASGPAIAKRFAQAVGKVGDNGDSSQGGAETVFSAASNGNKVAGEILTSAGEALGVSVAFLVNVLDPEMIIVGGGLGMAGGLYWDAFQRGCREHIFADNSRQVPIVSAKLGIDAGIVGAASTVFAKQQTQKAHFGHEENRKYTGVGKKIRHCLG
jgi:glucokinase